jgi:hypothetical protein
MKDRKVSQGKERKGRLSGEMKQYPNGQQTLTVGTAHQNPGKRDRNLQALQKCREGHGGGGIYGVREAGHVHRLMAEIRKIDQLLDGRDAHNLQPLLPTAIDNHATQAILDGMLGTERCLGDIDADLRSRGFQ